MLPDLQITLKVNVIPSVYRRKDAICGVISDPDTADSHSEPGSGLKEFGDLATGKGGFITRQLGCERGIQG